MFQNFRNETDQAAIPARLEKLRIYMQEQKFDGFLIPRSDAHMGEYVAACDERLAYMTGFTGSAGFAIVLADKAALFSDGRYSLQMDAQVPDCFEKHPSENDGIGSWLASNAVNGSKIAYDPWLHGRDEIARLATAAQKAGASLIESGNLVDQIWDDQPAAPQGKLRIHPLALSGRSPAKKREAIASELAAAGVDCAIITLPDSIAWAFDVRGADIERNPVPHAFAMLFADRTAHIFIDPIKLDDAVRAHLGNGVTCSAPDQLSHAIAALSGRKVALDPTTAPVWFETKLKAAGAEIQWQRDPCILPKACKTKAELAGMQACHLRDGAAMARFLCWLETEAPKGTLSEISIVEKLEAFRAANGDLLDISFDTICGAGPNGAIVHYRVNNDTNRDVKLGDVVLVDSGGQYADGTTDITRTVCVGHAPSDPRARRDFTLVLKGMINLSRARWPEGVAGRDLDALARVALWREGLDYGHGTGHGVGAHLCVHEGPQNISRRGMEPLKPGMVLSNEPGHYREGAFGIRIENLVVVKPAEQRENDERALMSFDTLTFCPIDRRMIDAQLLNQAERTWLNEYHAMVLAKIGPKVSDDKTVFEWLEAACAPI